MPESKVDPRSLLGANFCLKNHLESDWNDVPVDHITIDAQCPHARILHPYSVFASVLAALGIKRGGIKAFRAGCNRRWELAGINPAVIRQQMGHSE